MRCTLPTAVSGRPFLVVLRLCPAHCPCTACRVSAMYSAAMSLLVDGSYLAEVIPPKSPVGCPSSYVLSSTGFPGRMRYIGW